MQHNTNRLIHESSPYLLQHAHNPVNWFPWGEEALSLAQNENKPVLLSIGYSACHWCHVMERESFEDEETARYMNEHFINIKVDREERPDLDHIYMDAVQAIAGNGGWPLNVFLTPSLKPFYGGTYFPPKRAFNRPSWLEVLNSIKNAWDGKREELMEQSDTLTKHIGRSIVPVKKDQSEEYELFSETDCTLITRNLLQIADHKEGGFGNAPKFPQVFLIQYLLMYGHLYKDDKATGHALFSLKQMIRGGIYDQLAGGLCRYSTDNEWLVPHFEKMLYDNALLISALAEAYQVSGDNEFSDIIDSTYSFLSHEMKSDEGLYFAALDADSEGEEGKFYVWSREEVEAVVGNEADLCCRWFDVSSTGNWEAKNILNLKKDIGSFASENGLSAEELLVHIDHWKKKLLQARSSRIRPGTDDKIILSWNALLVTAFCKAYAATGNEKFRTESITLYTLLKNKFRNEDGFFHTYKNGKARIPAFLDDYAFFIKSAIHLQEITGNEDYLKDAEQYSGVVMKDFTAADGLFYYTGISQVDIVLRKTELFDGAIPSGNSVMNENLFYLSKILGKQQWHSLAVTGIDSMKEFFLKYPSSFGVWCSTFLKHTAGILEIAVTGADTTELLKEILKRYLPNKVLQSGNKPSEYPLLQFKSFEKQTFIYLCKDYSCKEPVKTIKEFEAQING